MPTHALGACLLPETTGVTGQVLGQHPPVLSWATSGATWLGRQASSSDSESSLPQGQSVWLWDYCWTGASPDGGELSSLPGASFL